MKEGEKKKREIFYPELVLQPGPLALRASALPLRYPGQLPIQGRINLFEPILSDLRTYKLLWLLRPIEAYHGSRLGCETNGPGSIRGPA